MGSSRSVRCNGRTRRRRAVNAMKPLGISEEQTVPVLKRLAKLYDDQWEFIEDDSYRVLIDAILDQQANDGAVNDDGNQPDLGLGKDDRQRPSSSLAVVVRKERHLQRVDEHLQPSVFLGEPEPLDMDALDCLDEQPGLVRRPRKRKAPSSEILALPPPEKNPKQISQGDKNRTVQRCRNMEISKLPVELSSSTMNNETGPGIGNVQEAPCSDIDVASSPMGEVKMSLKFSVHPSKFNMPDLEAVLKMVEEKCLRSPKVLSPDFSVRGLLTEICERVLQLGTEHTVEHDTQSDNVGNGNLSENGINMKEKAEGLLVSKGLESAPANSSLAHQDHLALSISRTIHDVTDITKGQENLRISIIDESGREKLPPSFYYTPSNVVFQNALVSMFLANISDEDCCSDCFGNCLSAPVSCACARETGGQYAYTPDGFLRPAFIDECVSMNRFPEEHHRAFCETCPLERSRNKASPEPCRGHLVRKFIKECWTKCGCNLQCGNRVVQRGIRCNLQVFSTGEGRGWGLRTLDELPKGIFVCEYAGEILTIEELRERSNQNMQNARSTHPIPLDAGWCSGVAQRDEQALCLDGTFYGNVGRFINHRCFDANLAMVPVKVEIPDRHYYHIAFFTSKKVQAFEELTWDYSIDFDDERQPVKASECLCGSRYCRGSRRHHLRKEKRNRVAAG